MEFDNVDDKKLGRTCKALFVESKLAKRSHEHRGLGDALHPFASTSPKLADHQKEPSASSSAKKLVEDVQQVGRSPTRAQATSPGEEEDACGASQPAASSGLVEDIQRIGRLEFDYAGREIDPDKR